MIRPVLQELALFLTPFAVYAIYLPELFPTSLRSTGTARTRVGVSSYQSGAAVSTIVAR